MNWKYIVWPVLLLGLLTPWSASLDKTISHFFYHEAHFQNPAWIEFIYNYGSLPGFLLAGIGVLALFWKKWRQAGVYLLLTFAVGEGLIIHGLLKDHWGRPRPRQVIEFGGHQEFRAYYQPQFFHQPEPSKSFACGHCGMGFFFFALGFFGLHYQKRWLTLMGFSLALILGGLLSFARIAQGGHFFSDTVVTALIMWLTATIFYWIIFRGRDERTHSEAT